MADGHHHQAEHAAASTATKVRPRRTASPIIFNEGGALKRFSFFIVLVLKKI